MIDCESTSRRLFGYLDRAIDEAQVREIEAHLAQCGRCTGAVDAERRLLAAIANTTGQADDTLRRRILQAILAANNSQTGDRAP